MEQGSPAVLRRAPRAAMVMSGAICKRALEPLKQYKDRDWELSELVAEFEGRREAYHDTVERNQPAAERRAAIRAQRKARMAELSRRRQRGEGKPTPS